MSARLKQASRFALKHLAVSVVIAALCAALVFGVWYPYPYSQLAGGRELFTIVVSVDVIIGPLLSLVVFDPAKRKAELWRDIGFVFLAQVAALAYGLHSVSEARPVWLAFEGDRFRIVAVPDIDLQKLPEAPAHLQRLSLSGPKLVGVRLLESGDPGFLKSIEDALQGNHPAFRPERWIDFDGQRDLVVQRARPVSELARFHPDRSAEVMAAIAEAGESETDLGYLPLLSQKPDEWIVLVSRRDGEPRAYLRVGGP